MKLRLLGISVIAMLLGAASVLAQQQSGSPGDASNSQQNGENTQTHTGGQPGGASDRN